MRSLLLLRRTTPLFFAHHPAGYIREAVQPQVNMVISAQTWAKRKPPFYRMLRRSHLNADVGEAAAHVIQNLFGEDGAK